MIRFCDSCKIAYHDSDMFSENLCYSCHYAGPLGVEQEGKKILAQLNGRQPVEGPDPDEKQMKLFFGENDRLTNRKKYSDEACRKMSISQMGHPVSEQTKRKISESAKGNKYRLGKKHSKETKIKISKSMKGKTWKLSEETKYKMKGPKSPEHIAALCKATQIRPTRPETKLATILNRIFPGEYKYVGNGEIIIGRKNPDFININGKKKIIEMFGNYWHKKEDSQIRINAFKPFGFETFIVWEKELKNFKSLEQRLEEFHRS
jgi:G:T-mismatch repair DNA endonuclease (very short patch repair protein)